MSLEYKINALKQTWVQTLTEITDRGDIGKLIDLLTKLSEGIGNVISNVGVLRTAFMGFAAVWGSKRLGLFDTGNNKTLVGGIAEIVNNKRMVQQRNAAADVIRGIFKDNKDNFLDVNFEKLDDRFASIKDSLIKVQKQAKETGKSGEEAMEMFADEMKEVNVTSSTLITTIANIGKAIVNAFASMVISYAISNIVEWVAGLIDEWSGAATKRRTEEALKQIKEVTDTYKETAKSIDSVKKKYEELNEQLKDSNITVEQEKDIKTELLGIQDDLVDKYGREAEHLDLVNGKYQEQLDLLENINKNKARDYLYGKEGVMLPNEDGKTPLELANEYLNAHPETDTYYGMTETEGLAITAALSENMALGHNFSNMSQIVGFDMQELLNQYDALSEFDGKGLGKVFLRIDENKTKKEVYEQLTDLLQDIYKKLGSDKNAWPKFAENVTGTIENYIRDLNFDPTEYAAQLENIKQAARAQMIYSGDNDIATLEEDAKNAVTAYNKAISDYEKGIEGSSKATVDAAEKDLFEITKRINAYNPGEAFKRGYDEIFNGIFAGRQKSIDDQLQEYFSKSTDTTFLSGYYRRIENLTSKEKIRLQAELPEDVRMLTLDQLDRLIADAQHMADNTPIEIKPEIKSSDAVTSMDKAKKALNSLSDLYNQVVTQDSNGNENTLFGYADPDKLLSIRSAFEDFTKELGDEEKTKVLDEALEHFEDTLIRFPNNAEIAQEAIDELVTAYIDQTDIIQNLTEENKEWSKAQLKAMGVTNAEEVILDRLTKTQKKSAKYWSDLTDAVNAYDDAIRRNDTDEATKQLDAMASSLNNIFGDGEIKPFDSAFVKDNLDLIKQFNDGVDSAKYKLQELAAERYIAHVELNGNADEVNAMRNELTNLISQFDGSQIEIGASLDNHPILKAFMEIARQAGLTAKQIQQVFASAGVKSVIRYKKLPKELEAMIYNTQGAKAVGEYYKKYGTQIVDTLTWEPISKATTATVSIPSSNTTSGGSGGSSGGGDNNLNEDTEETYDWIEVKLQRLEEAYGRLDKTSSSVYKSWKERNDAVNDSLEVTKERIDADRAAYNRYIKERDAYEVKAPNKDDYDGNTEQYEYDLKQYQEYTKRKAEFAKKVREGQIGKDDDIEYLSNKYIKEYVDMYTQWNDKATAAYDNITDQEERYYNDHVEMFDNIKTQFDELISEFTHGFEIIDEQINRTEAHGYFVSKKYYQDQKQLVSKQLTEQKKQYNDLVNARDKAVEAGALEQYSEAWYNMTNDINSVENEVNSLATQLVTLDKNIRQLSWDGFDWAIDRLGVVTDEAEFLIDLLDQHDIITDLGRFNERGWASVGLHAIEYDTYMAKAVQYAQQLRAIEEQMVKDPYDKELIARREELLGLQQESIKAAEAEKEAVRDLVEQAINKNLEALQELIDKYKESLSEAKELYSYSKNINQQTENIANLEKQLQAYAGDDSEETRATIQNLQKSLEDAKESLMETEWDKYISETEKILDDMYEDYSDTLNARLDDID